MKDRAIKHLMRSYGIDIENDDEFLSDLRKIMDDLYVKCPLCGEAENLHENTNYHDTSKPPEILCNECGEYFLSPITPEPGESGQKRESPFIGEITISDLRKLFAHRASRISEDINQGANQLMTLTDFRLALADMRWRIYNDGLSEPGESGQSAEDELMRKVFYSSLKHTSDFPINNMKLFKELSFEMMTTYASQVCADKDREISLLKKELDRAKEEIEKSHMDKIYSIHDLKSELSAANESLTVMLRSNAELEEQNKKYWFMIEHGLGVEDMTPPTYPHP